MKELTFTEDFCPVCCNQLIQVDSDFFINNGIQRITIKKDEKFCINCGIILNEKWIRKLHEDSLFPNEDPIGEIGKMVLKSLSM